MAVYVIRFLIRLPWPASHPRFSFSPSPFSLSLGRGRLSPQLPLSHPIARTLGGQYKNGHVPLLGGCHPNSYVFFCDHVLIRFMQILASTMPNPAVARKPRIQWLPSQTLGATAKIEEFQPTKSLFIPRKSEYALRCNSGKPHPAPTR